MVLHLDGDTQSAEASLRVLLQFIVLHRLHELAVRVQGVDHPLERAVNKLLVGELLSVHVVRAYLGQDVRKQFQARVRGVLVLHLRRVDIDMCSNDVKGHQQHDQHSVNDTSFHKNLFNLPSDNSCTASLLQGTAWPDNPAQSTGSIRRQISRSPTVVLTGLLRSFTLHFISDKLLPW